jgi:outer membrane lipoprotein-sorting protein
MLYATGTLFHELSHGSTVTMVKNDNLGVADINIKLKTDNGFKWETAYRPTNAKILARTVSDDNFSWVSLLPSQPV